MRPATITLAATALALLTLASCTERGATNKGQTTDNDSSAIQPKLMFGIPVDSFTVEQVAVGKGQILSQILTNAGLSYDKALETYDKALPVFDFRQMRPGQSCYIFYRPDTAEEASVAHFVYDISPMSYVRCSYGDTLSVERLDRTVSTERRRIEATIRTSLWEALTSQNVSAQLTLDMADIFAWTVDFFGLEEGDKFTLLYDARAVDGQTVGTGTIVAALYENKNGKKQYAFRHESDSIVGYYDAQGNSLKRAFLKAPLKYSRISSRFSHGRKHPILKIRRAHHGVDYAAPKGTPVFAIGDGKVIAKGFDKKGGGNYVKIRHNSVYTTVYMHLNNFAKGLVTGQQVQQGQQIGNVGSTGLATGPHLDFRVFQNGKPIDPLKMEMPPAEPITNDDLEDFLEESEKMIEALKRG